MFASIPKKLFNMPKFVHVRPHDMDVCGDMYKFYCPACKECHWVAVGPRSVWGDSPRWSFNENFDSPTINPSLLVTYKMPEGEKRCHSFIREGKIQYLSDCTHEMAGKTVDIPEFPNELIDE